MILNNHFVLIQLIETIIKSKIQQIDDYWKKLSCILVN